MMPGEEDWREISPDLIRAHLPGRCPVHAVLRDLEHLPFVLTQPSGQASVRAEERRKRRTKEEETGTDDILLD